MATFIPHFRLANLMGEHELHWPVATVKELLERGRKEYGADFETEIKAATVLVNGRAISYLDGEKTSLSDTDEVWTVLPSAGG